jgi:hypothetical protein
MLPSQTFCQTVLAAMPQIRATSSVPTYSDSVSTSGCSESRRAPIRCSRLAEEPALAPPADMGAVTFSFPSFDCRRSVPTRWVTDEPRGTRASATQLTSARGSRGDLMRLIAWLLTAQVPNVQLRTVREKSITRLKKWVDFA